MNMNDYRNVTDRIVPSERCREEVLNMKNERNRKNITHKRRKGAVAAAVVIAVAVCGGGAAVAAELGAFDRLSDKQDRTITLDNGIEVPIDKHDRNEYSKIAPNAVEFEEVKSASNEFFTVDLESAYFDGTELIFGFSGEIADGNSMSFSSLGFTASLDINGERVTPYRIDGSYVPFYWGTFVIDEGTDNSFTGSMTCIIPAKDRFDDTAEITVSINNIWSNEKDYYENDQHFSYQIMELGCNDLVLSADVTPDLSLVRTINKTAEHDGFSTTIYSIAPGMMLSKCEYPESYDVAMDEEILNGTEDGYCHAVHPIAFFFDEDGKYIEPLEIDPVDMPDGSLASASNSTESKYITVKWCDKNCESNELGSVEFDTFYGHYSFGYITEYTIDISDTDE